MFCCNKRSVLAVTSTLEASGNRSIMSSSKILLTSKVAIITGASAGMGEATAKLFSERGARLVLHGRNREKLEKIAQECQELSPEKHEATLVTGSIEDEYVRQSLIDAAVTNFGQLDILVNNAGYGGGVELSKMSVDNLRSMLECHTVAPYDLSLKAIPHLKNTKGCIVNTSSMFAERAVKHFISLSMAKAAISHFTRCLAVELGPTGIRVNAVAPGVIVTDIANDHVGKNGLEAFGRALHPIGRAGTPDEVAQVIAFLASDAASLLTALVIPVDGGACAAPRDISAAM